MSVNKFKVGDKVRVREGLVADEFYGDVHFADFMVEMSGKILTIRGVDEYCYKVAENQYDWSDEMLEPIIEINGKNYKKADVEEAIKDLEVVE